MVVTADAASGDNRPAPPTQRPLLACTACCHTFIPTCSEITQLGATGCPRCQGWTWLVSLSAPLASDPVPVPRGRDEESRHV
ncbi:hypothetical protein TOK_2328 [Pseudonocardia sp. N23]|nr:hypothetical protein TOK_2328 [Pseudonocardia sp. N23]